jgi:hypothetical protein
VAADRADCLPLVAVRLRAPQPAVMIPVRT